MKTTTTIIFFLLCFSAWGQDYTPSLEWTSTIQFDGNQVRVNDTPVKQVQAVYMHHSMYEPKDTVGPEGIEAQLINKPGARLYHSIDSSGLPTISTIWALYESILVHKDSVKTKQQFKKYASLDAMSALKRATKGYLYKGENAFVGRVVEISFDAIMTYEGKQVPCRAWIEDATIYYSPDGQTWHLAPKGSSFTFTAKIE